MAAVPQHSLVLLMPHLDSFLPLILIQLVLLQNPGFNGEDNASVRIQTRKLELRRPLVNTNMHRTHYLCGSSFSLVR